MRITRISTTYLEYPLSQPMYDATHFIASRGALLVSVETDAGIVGTGEAACFGGGWRAVKVEVEEVIAPIACGRDPLKREQIWETVYRITSQHSRRGVGMMALSGVDIALWDIAGKVAGLPLHKLLGGFEDSVPAYASCGFYQEGKGPSQLVEEIDDALRQGFRAVKVKIGRNAFPSVARYSNEGSDGECRVSIEEDLKRIDAVRKHVGTGFPFMIDANGSWDPGLARSLARAYAESNPFFLEEPVSIDNASVGGSISRDVGVPVAGYETEFTRYGFRDLVAMQAVDFVQPDLTWAGGLSEVLRIAALAEMYGLPLVPHCFSSAICLAATAHLLAGRGIGKFLEFDVTPNALRSSLLKEPLEVSADGRVYLSDRPGLGIELRRETLEKYAVSSR